MSPTPLEPPDDAHGDPGSTSPSQDAPPETEGIMAKSSDSPEPARPRAEPRQAESPWLRVARWCATLLAIAVVAYTLRDADLRTTLKLLRTLGLGFLWVLIPYAVGTFFHALAWRRLLLTLGRPTPTLSLMGILLASEAVRMTFPGGPALGESMSVVLLKERFGIETSQGVASIAAKKALVTFTNGVTVLLALGLGWSSIRAASTRLFGGPWLVALFIGSAVALFALAGSMVVALVSQRTVRRMAAGLARLPIRALRQWLSDREHHIAAADSALAAPFARGRWLTLVPPGILVLIQWGAETVETVLVLRLLGAPLGLVSGFASEVAGSLIRSFAFVLPAGLGVQDAGYITMFDALSGTRLATIGAAFVLVKRAKELFWILVGYILLFLGRRSRRAPSWDASVGTDSAKHAVPSDELG